MREYTQRSRKTEFFGASLEAVGFEANKSLEAGAGGVGSSNAKLG
jgi:hypothetical protein